MQEGIFTYGLMVGRMQHIHIGHEKLIRIGLSLCDKFLVFLGSANQPQSERNPYTYEYRKELIETIFKDEIESGKLVVAPLNDFEDSTSLTPEWGEYVISSATQVLGGTPNLIVYGKDKDIFKCFSKETVQNISEVFVDRKALEISATVMRNYLNEDKKEEWMKYANPLIYNKYDELKEILSQSCKKN